MSKCSADLYITEQLINLVCPSCLFLEHSLSTFKPKYRNSCLVCWLCTFALNWAVWEGVAVSLPDTKYVRNCDLAWVMMPLLFFIFPSPLPQISELPEREEGEGEETPNFSHWGPPRTYVHMITFLLWFFGFFSVSHISSYWVFFFLSSSASNFRVPVYLGLSWDREFLTDVQQNSAFYLYSWLGKAWLVWVVDDLQVLAHLITIRCEQCTWCCAVSLSTGSPWQDSKLPSQLFSHILAVNIFRWIVFMVPRKIWSESSCLSWWIHAEVSVQKVVWNTSLFV